MTTLLDVPATSSSAPAPSPASPPNADDLRDLEDRLERRSIRRDNWTVMMFGIAIVALLFSVMAVGFGVRAISESKDHAQTSPGPSPAVVPALPVAVALSTVTLSDMKVAPSSTLVPAGRYNITITNAGMMPHELLVFHTDIAPADLPIGTDGKVAEDAPGFKISDGDNLDPGASQTRLVDLTVPGTYLFVCNLPGHFQAGMHTVVTVR